MDDSVLRDVMFEQALNGLFGLFAARKYSDGGLHKNLRSNGNPAAIQESAGHAKPMALAIRNKRAMIRLRSSSNRTGRRRREFLWELPENRAYRAVHWPAELRLAGV
jgi:hypothetical protein